jgi:hypothetical protein
LSLPFLMFLPIRCFMFLSFPFSPHLFLPPFRIILHYILHSFLLFWSLRGIGVQVPVG